MSGLAGIKLDMSEHLNYELAIDTWGDEEREAIKGVIDSGQFTMGSKVLEFESYFAEYFGRGEVE